MCGSYYCQSESSSQGKHIKGDTNKNNTDKRAKCSEVSSDTSNVNQVLGKQCKKILLFHELCHIL